MGNCISIHKKTNNPTRREHKEYDSRLKKLAASKTHSTNSITRLLHSKNIEKHTERKIEIESFLQPDSQSFTPDNSKKLIDTATSIQPAFELQPLVPPQQQLHTELKSIANSLSSDAEKILKTDPLDLIASDPIISTMIIQAIDRQETPFFLINKKNNLITYMNKAARRKMDPEIMDQHFEHLIPEQYKESHKKIYAAFVEAQNESAQDSHLQSTRMGKKIHHRIPMKLKDSTGNLTIIPTEVELTILSNGYSCALLDCTTLVTALKNELALQVTQASILHMIRHEENNLEQSISANLEATYSIISEEIIRLRQLQAAFAKKGDDSTLMTTIANLEIALIKLSLVMIGKNYIKIVENDILSPNTKVTFSIISWLTDMFFMFSEECGNKIRIEKDGLLLSDDDYIVFGDQATLLYAFVNIVKNAIKFTSNINADGLITVSLERNNNYFSILVKDNGIGMTQEQAEHCFDIARKKYNPHIQGSGSGLSNVKQKLLKASGNITVQSAPNEGSLFTITLPLEIKEILHDFIDYSIVHLLAAEDEPITRKLLKKMLTNIGIKDENISIAASREEATTLYQTKHHEGKPFDIVITDLNMPNTNEGLDLVQDIRHFELENKTSTPAHILILSGNHEEDIEVKKIRNLFNEYSTKPYNKKKLLPLITPTVKKVNSREKMKVLSQLFESSPEASTKIASLITEYSDSSKSLTMTRS